MLFNRSKPDLAGSPRAKLSPRAPGQMLSKLDNGNKFYSQKMFAGTDGRVIPAKREVPKVLFELNTGDRQKRAAADQKV